MTAAALALSACGQSDKAGGAATGASQAAPVQLKTAFNQSETHPQYLALKDFSDKLEKETEGRYKLDIQPNALLGDQRAALELVQSGAIQAAVVANPLIENFDKNFAVLAMPYVYDSLDHQRKVYTSDALDKLFSSTKGKGFEVLTAYTAGARSMYIKGAPIKTPADMKGKKIRVMQSDTMVKMLACMGGTGVPMSQGEVYTAIQQGVLDGAENNEITYSDLKQYEVAPTFSETRHVMVADLLVVNEDFLAKMDAKDQATFRKLAKDSTATEFDIWDKTTGGSIDTAKKAGATFTQVDIKPFQKSCESLQTQLMTTPEQKALFATIRKMAAN